MEKREDWEELNGEAISIIRGHMGHAGIKPTFVDDGVHLLVVELLELRRQFNNGEALDITKVLTDEPFCRNCQFPKEHHGLGTVDCPGYTPPEVQKKG